MIGKNSCHLVPQRLVEKVVMETNDHKMWWGYESMENVRSMISEPLIVGHGRLY